MSKHVTKPATLTVVVDLNTPDESKKYGLNIISATLPDGLIWAPGSAMGKHSVLPVKVKAEVDAKRAAKVKAEPEPVASVTADQAQQLLATPGIASILQQLLQAQGTATVAPAPTLKAARGRPRKAS